jgi:hypothetical protein
MFHEKSLRGTNLGRRTDSLFIVTKLERVVRVLVINDENLLQGIVLSSGETKVLVFHGSKQIG